MKVRRFDRSMISPSKRTSEGFLRIDGSKIARTGIQIYRRSDGSEVRELRLPDEVFSPACIASFKLLPVTDMHPTKLLDVNDAKAHAVGAVGQPFKVDNKWLAADISVWDAAAIESIEKGRTQLSAGYTCELVEESGEWNGEKYDCKQVGIVANHLAIVDAARAGAEARLKLDGADAEAIEFAGPVERVVVSNPQVATSTESDPMPIKLKLDGFEIEVADENAKAIIERSIAAAKASGEKLAADVQSKLDASEKDRTALQAKFDVAQSDAERMTKCDECDGTGKISGEKCDMCDGKGEYPAKMDVAEVRALLKKKLDRDFNVRASARAGLLATAQRVLGLNEKLDDTKSDVDIKKLVVEKLNPDMGKKLEGRGDDYVTAVFDTVLASEPTGIERARSVTLVTPSTIIKNSETPAVEQPRADERDPEKAHENMIARTHATNVRRGARG